MQCSFQCVVCVHVPIQGHLHVQVQCGMNNVQCAGCSVQGAVCKVQCAGCSVQGAKDEDLAIKTGCFK